MPLHSVFLLQCSEENSTWKVNYPQPGAQEVTNFQFYFPKQWDQMSTKSKEQLHGITKKIKELPQKLFESKLSAGIDFWEKSSPTSTS